MQNAGVNAAQAMMSFMAGAQDKIGQKVTGGAFSSELKSQQRALLGKSSGPVLDGGGAERSSGSSMVASDATGATTEETKLGAKDGLSDATRTKLVREKASENLYFTKSELVESVLGKLGVSAQDRQNCNFTTDDQGRVSIKSLTDALDSLRKKTQAAAASLTVSPQDVSALLASLQQTQGQNVTASDLAGLKIDSKSSYNASELTTLLQGVSETLGKKSLTHFVSDRNGSSTVSDLVDESSTTADSGLTDDPQRLVRSLTPSLSNGVAPVKPANTTASGAAASSSSSEDKPGRAQDAPLQPFVDAYAGVSAAAMDASTPSSGEEAPLLVDVKASANNLSHLKDSPLEDEAEDAPPEDAAGEMAPGSALSGDAAGPRRNSASDGASPLSFASSFRNVRTTEANPSPIAETVPDASGPTAEGDASAMRDASDADRSGEASHALPDALDETASASASRGGSGASFSDGRSDGESDGEDSPFSGAASGLGADRTARIEGEDNQGAAFMDNLMRGAASSAAATSTSSPVDSTAGDVGLSNALNGLWKAVAGGDDLKAVSDSGGLAAPLNPSDAAGATPDDSGVVDAADRFLAGALGSADLNGSIDNDPFVKPEIAYTASPAIPVDEARASTPADSDGTSSGASPSGKAVETASNSASTAVRPDVAAMVDNPATPIQAVDEARDAPSAGSVDSGATGAGEDSLGETVDAASNQAGPDLSATPRHHSPQMTQTFGTDASAASRDATADVSSHPQGETADVLAGFKPTDAPDASGTVREPSRTDSGAPTNIDKSATADVSSYSQGETADALADSKPTGASGAPGTVREPSRTDSGAPTNIDKSATADVSSYSQGETADALADSKPTGASDAPGTVRELSRTDSGGALTNIYADADAGAQAPDAVDGAAASPRHASVEERSDKGVDPPAGGAEQAVKAPARQSGAASTSTGGDSRGDEDAAASIDDLGRLDKNRSQKIVSEHYQPFAESLQNSVGHHGGASGGSSDGVLSINDPSWTQDLTRQIQDLHRQDRNRMTLELEPRSLGKLTITIEAVNDQVKAVVSTGSEHVRDMLLNNSSTLTAHLQQEGLTLNQLQVDVRQQGSGRQAFEQSWARQGAQGFSSEKEEGFDQTPQSAINAAYIRPATSGHISLFA